MNEDSVLRYVMPALGLYGVAGCMEVINGMGATSCWLCPVELRCSVGFLIKLDFAQKQQ